MLSLTLLCILLCFFFPFKRAFLRLTLILLLTHLFIFVFCFLFFCNLSITRMHLPPVLYYLMSPSLRYVSVLSSFFFFSFAHISSAICHWLSHLPLSIIISYRFLCSSFFFFFFLSSKMSLSLSPYITPRLRRFLPPWAHLWEVSLIGLMWCLRS